MLDLSLYLIASLGNRTKKEFLGVIELALQGGVTIVQLREKNLESSLFYQLACALKELCAHYQVLFLINDRLDIALSCGADGVHIGQNDLPIHIVRKILGVDKIIGLSAHKIEHLNDSNLADYLGVGSVFATPSKKDSTIIGTKGISRILAHTTLPVVAIGGIGLDNINALQACREISGIAVIRAIMDSNDPKIAATELKRAFVALKNGY